MNHDVKIHKPGDSHWTDEKGIQVPVSRVTKAEKNREKSTARLLNGALKLNEQLKAFKQEVFEITSKLYREHMEASGLDGKDMKGNWTLYNFDRSIKVDVSVKDRIEFDDLEIEAAKQKFNTFLDQNVSATDEFIKDLIMDAFNTSKGKLDVKKVTSLLGYRTRVKEPLFQEALDHIENGMRRPSSKTYFQVFARCEDGSYEAINLNFSAI